MTRLELVPPRTQSALSSRPFRHIPSQDGGTRAVYYREGGGTLLLRFPGLADYRVSADLEQVTCVPVPGAGDDACHGTFASMVLPAILDKRGNTVVHASGVEMEGGAVLFLGDSGSGKSTLAASFARAGHRLLTDDGILIERVQDTFHAHPRTAFARLWLDSVEALLPGVIAPSIEGAKASVPMGSGMEPCVPIAVRAAFFLGDGSAREPSIGPIGPAASLLAWVGQSYLLDTEDNEAVAAQFERLSALSNGIPCYRLDYPRRFEALADVHRAVIEHLQRGAPFR